MPQLDPKKGFIVPRAEIQESTLHLFTMQKGQKWLFSLLGLCSFSSRIKRHAWSFSARVEKRGNRREEPSVSSDLLCDGDLPRRVSGKSCVNGT